MRGAVGVVLHEIAGTHAQELNTWLGTMHEWPEEWRRTFDLSDFKLLLTPELSMELVAEMHELIEGYRGVVDDEDTPEAEQVRVHTHLFPVKTD